MPYQKLITNNRFVSAALLCGSIALLTSCASRQLRVTTEPAGSLVTLRNPAGETVGSTTAPLDAKIKLKGKNGYTVEVQPPPGMSERYAPATAQVTTDVYEALPQLTGPDSRQLEIKLEEKAVVIVPYVEVVLDPRRAWRGVVTRSRAYKDVSETGGKVPTRILEFGDNLGIQSLALSPDGNRIIYSVANYGLSPSDLQAILATSELKVIDITGANLSAVSVGAAGIEHITSENFRDLFPSFTADGQKLLFSSNRRRAGSEDILMISSTQRGPISDVYVHRDARILRPTQSDDGTIAFSVEEPNPIDAKQRFTIWTIGGLNRFPTQIQTGSQPAISPDGKRIAYIGQDENLWMVNSDGSLPTQLTFGSDKILESYRQSLSKDELARYQAFVAEFGFSEKMPFSYPSWSKDGKYILYTGMEGSDPSGRPNEDIWVMRFDGSEKRQLTTNGSIDRYPMFSPDAKWVYFMSNRGGRWAIWRIQGPEAGGA
jgi:dipeptidyl aminopeptidase/acylaminoacyl peptidase